MSKHAINSYSYPKAARQVLARLVSLLQLQGFARAGYYDSDMVSFDRAIDLNTQKCAP